MQLDTALFFSQGWVSWQHSLRRPKVLTGKSPPSVEQV